MALTLMLLLDVCVAAAACVLLYRILRKNPVAAHLPPGPKPLPFIGNLFEWPATGTNEWETFARWRNQFGDLVYANVVGQPMLIINSYELAVTLLDKKGAIYSDRPISPPAAQIAGAAQALALKPNCDAHKRLRRLTHQLFGTKADVERFYPTEERQAHKLLQHLLYSPGDVNLHVKHYIGSVILKIVYGYDAPDFHDPFLQSVNRVVSESMQYLVPGAFMVDWIPALAYLPEWCPGGIFKAIGKRLRVDLEKMAQDPYDFVKTGVANGTALPSFTQALIERKQHMTKEDDYDVKWAAASLYVAGADTSNAIIKGLFPLLAMHPDILVRAQVELDQVVGGSRLPTIADRAQLPYVDALCKELLRFNVVAPIGLPHRLSEDDIHDDYLIPKGSIVFANLHSMLHDPLVYQRPHLFDPTRFLPLLSGRSIEQDPRSIVFGFGRRICPGINLADPAVFIAVAMIIATCNIQKAMENGRIVEPAWEKMPGLVSHPKSFNVSIAPRSPKAEQLIQGE